MFYNKYSIEGFLSYKKCKTRKISGILKNIFDEHNIHEEKEDNWDIYLFICAFIELFIYAFIH